MTSQMKKLALVGGLLLASCGTPGAAYVAADRETFNSVGVDYRNYVLSDATLNQDQRDLRLLTVESWRKRVEAAEGK